MKLYFKDNLTDSDKLKFLLTIMQEDPESPIRLLEDEYNNSINRGYFDTKIYSNEVVKQIKFLNIWKKTHTSPKIYNTQKKIIFPTKPKAIILKEGQFLKEYT